MRARSAHDLRPNWRGTSTYHIPSFRLSSKRKCFRIAVVSAVVTVLTLALDLILSGGSALGWLLQIWTILDFSEPSVHAGEFIYF